MIKWNFVHKSSTGSLKYFSIQSVNDTIEILLAFFKNSSYRLEDGAPKSKGKRNSRSNNQTQSFRLNEEQKSRMTNQRNSNDQRPPASMSRPPQSNGKAPVKDDGSNLGVYMTMDELAELVKAVKENAKSNFETFFFVFTTFRIVEYF